jgi:hypothetical protein
VEVNDDELGKFEADARQSRVLTTASAVLRRCSAKRRLSLSFGRQRECSPVAFDCLCRHAPSGAEDRREWHKQAVVFEILFGNKMIDEPKTLFWTVNHGDCNGAVQRNDGRWLRLCQRIIQADDLPPITIGGKRTLAELFDGRSQLILYSSCGAPLASLQAFKQRMGWRFPWVSSSGSDFNFDYHVSFTPEQLATGEVYYNYKTIPAGIEELFRNQCVLQGCRRPSLP